MYMRLCLKRVMVHLHSPSLTGFCLRLDFFEIVRQLVHGLCMDDTEGNYSTCIKIEGACLLTKCQSYCYSSANLIFLTRFTGD